MNGMLGRPFYFIIRGERFRCIDLEKNGTKMDIALSQTCLKLARLEREVVNLHQPFLGLVKEYNIHQSVQSSARFPCVYVQSSVSAQSFVSFQSSAASSSHQNSSSGSSKIKFLSKTARRV